MAVRRVLTNIFGKKEVLAYVTSPEKGSSSRRLFFSTVSPEQLQLSCTWQEKSQLNQTGQPYAVYPPDVVCFPMGHRGELLRTKNILVIMQLYGAQPQRD